MTSTVTGDLRAGVGFGDIFRALFPCGSVTGAPKIRAMQLVAQIEPQPRGVYTGAVGFFSPRQTVFNVAIRTLTLDGQRGTMGVGSGIVIDSIAGEEFRECQLKAEFLTRAFDREDFALIESLLWRAAYPLLKLHLDRLADSAEYFGFSCERAEVEAALMAHASEFPSGQSRKVRLLLHRNGSLHIESEPLAPAGEPAQPGRVRIARQRTDSGDRMFYHKTTRRRLYAEAFRSAAAAGLEDAIFLNERGEATEGAVNNVYIEKDGRWFTPPVECGLLAGVFRRHLLATRPEIGERALSIDDLREADAVYLSNAVRGLRRVEIAWE